MLNNACNWAKSSFMKNMFYLMSLAIILFSSCQENSPIIDDLDDDIVIVDGQQKNVLIEKYTSVGCSNCPQATNIIKGITESNGSRVIPVGVHVSEMPNEINGTVQNLNNSEIDAFKSFVGNPNSLPLGAIDRTLFDGQNNIMIGRDEFIAYTNERLEEALKVEINVSTAYDASQRFAEVDVELNPLSNLDYQDLILNVVLVEDGIVDAQSNSGGIVEDFVHDYVLRDFFTPVIGSPIDALITGEVISKSFSLELPTNLVAENCRVVAFVSRSEADKEVFQVVDANLTE